MDVSNCKSGTSSTNVTNVSSVQEFAGAKTECVEEGTEVAVSIVLSVSGMASRSDEPLGAACLSQVGAAPAAVATVPTVR